MTSELSNGNGTFVQRRENEDSSDNESIMRRVAPGSESTDRGGS